MSQAIYAFAGAALTILTALSAGTILLKLLKVRLHREAQRLLAFFTGAAILSTLVFALAALHLLHKGVFVGLAALILAASFRGWRYHDGPQPEVPREKWLLFGLVMAAFGAIYIVKAWAPEHSPDGVMYHLGLVSRSYRERGFQPIVTNMYAHLSQGLELLFVFAYSIGRHSAAALVHCAFLIALPLAILTFSRRFVTGSSGILAASLVFVSPIFGMTGTSAYNDVALAAILFAIFWTLELWRDLNHRGLVIVAGLLAGFAFAIKYTGAFGAILALVYLRKRPKDALLAIACASIIGGPWLIKNIIYTGNPIAPFANSLFPNPIHYIDLERNFHADMQTYDNVKPRELPLEVTVKGGRTGGLLGPVFLLAPIGLLALRTALGRRVLATAVLVAIPFAFNIGTRFLLPAAVFVALALAISLARWPRLMLATGALHALLSWPWIVPAYAHPGAWRISEFPWRAALRVEPEDAFLSQRSFAYVQARLIEMHVPPNERVFSFGGMAADAYTSRELVVGFQSALGTTIREVLLTPVHDALQPTRWLEFRFPPQQARELRVCNTASAPDVWSVSELRLFHQGIELQRAPAWRLQASPNPWQVQRAFDNSPITRWSAHQPSRPGMCIQVALAGPTALDAIRVDSSRDQYKVRLKLEFKDIDWREVKGSLEDIEAPALPQRLLRRAAVEEAKTLGVQWLIISDGDFRADDFWRNQDDWGIRFVDRRGDAKLYRME